MHPELGHIGPIVIRTYTLLLDVAILVGLGALAWQGERQEGRPAAWVDAGLGALILGVIGGRLAHAAIYWAYFSERPVEIVQAWRGGLDWHGAVIGGLLGVALGSKLRGVSFRAASDVLAFVLPLGAALAQAGCFLSSCGHGREVETLGVYPSFLVMELPDIYGVIAPRFASQLFAAVGSLLVLLAVALLLRRMERPGVRFWVALGVLALAMFGVGFTRGDSVPPVGILRLDQALDLAIVVVSIGGAWLSIFSWRPPPPKEPPILIPAYRE